METAKNNNATVQTAKSDRCAVEAAKKNMGSGAKRKRQFAHICLKARPSASQRCKYMHVNHGDGQVRSNDLYEKRDRSKLKVVQLELSYCNVYT